MADEPLYRELDPTTVGVPDLADEAGLPPPGIFPDCYDFKCLLARTQMSTTWKAYNRDTEAFEVIKEPSARIFVSKSLKEQFRQEIRLIAALSHTNIVGLRRTEVSEPP